MGVLDDLARARTDYERGDWAAALDTWSGVDATRSAVDDLRGAGHGGVPRSAGATRRSTRYQRAFRAVRGRRRPAGGVTLRVPAGDDLRRPAASRRWRPAGPPGRSGCSTSSADDAVEAGYVPFLQMYRAPRRGRLRRRAPRRRRDRRRSAAATASATWWRSGCAAQGRIAIYAGRAAEGLALLDEAMVAVAAGEVSPEVSRQRLLHRDRGLPGDRRLRPGRRVDLGAAPLVRRAARTGHVHRPVLGPPWPGDAASAAPGRTRWTSSTAAAERYRLANTPDAIGQAEGERGDVLRLQGEYAAAEAAYERAGERGFDPQPGLALLWLARGSAGRRRGRRTTAGRGDRRPGRQVPRCSPQRSTCCSPATRSTRPARPQRSWTRWRRP